MANGLMLIALAPLAPIFNFHAEKEAIAIANDTQAGLPAYFCTRDLGRSWRMAEALEYGIAGVNELYSDGNFGKLLLAYLIGRRPACFDKLLLNYES